MKFSSLYTKHILQNFGFQAVFRFRNAIKANLLLPKSTLELSSFLAWLYY